MTTEPGATALRLEGVSVRFGARTALDDVRFEARPGELVALVGPNGSGKTTLLRVALGTCVPQAGTVELFGDPVAGLSVRERARRLAWVPQEEPLRDNVRIATYVLYGRFARLGPVDAEGESDRAAARAALEAVGLLDRAHDGVLEVSGGERQRLVLARALCQDAPLLLLDEPTAHLDIGHQLDLLARVRDQVRRRGRAAVAAIHDLNLASRFADRLVVLSRGRVVAEGRPGSVLSSALLRRVWGVDAELRHDRRDGLPYLLPRAVDDGGGAPGGGWGPVHVVGGGGSAAGWMEELVDAGYRVTAGALHLLDTDAETAQRLGVPTALEGPFAPLSDEVRGQNRALIAGARVILIAPFAVGPSNLGNLEDVAAAPSGIPRLLVGDRDAVRLDFCDGAATRLLERLEAAGAVRCRTDESVRSMLESLRRAGSEARTASTEGAAV